MSNFSILISPVLDELCHLSLPFSDHDKDVCKEPNIEYREQRSDSNEHGMGVKWIYYRIHSNEWDEYEDDWEKNKRQDGSSSVLEDCVHLIKQSLCFSL